MSTKNAFTCSKERKPVVHAIAGKIVLLQKKPNINKALAFNTEVLVVFTTILLS